MTDTEDWGSSEPDVHTPAPIIREVKRKERVTEAKAPPYSEEAEKHVIGCALAHDGVVRQCRESGLGPLDFYLPANRILFETVTRLDAAGQPTTTDVVAQELIDRKLLDEIGGIPGLMQLSEGMATTAHLSYFIDRVRQDSGKRAIIHKAQELIEHANNGTSLLELASDAKGWADTMVEEVRAPLKTENLKKLEERRITTVSAPAEPTTRLFLAGKPICTPGNITTLISRAKTGKTATIGGAIAAIIAAHHDRSGLDTLGFTAPHTKEAVVLIDTEQSPYDAFICHQRALARANQQTDMDWLCHYALVGYQVQEIRDAVIAALDSAVKLHKGVFMLIIDGIADLVASVNDEALCNELVNWVRGLSVKYNTPVICVIHSNEGVKTGDDGRGHLGKQLTRKAESNLLLKKTGEVTVVTSEKQRKAPITEADGVAFQWSDEAGRHVSCKAAPKNPNMGRPSKYSFTDIEAIFRQGGFIGLPFNQALRSALSSGLKDATFRRLVKEAVDSGDLVKETDKTGGALFRIADRK